ncbi:MAG: hypothetical protein JKY33_03265 [Bacteroidia bacterium]|nr:hypothetical protein [Bacteroidia bacterium]
MKTNLNKFINSLSYLDILYINNNIGSSAERIDVIKKVKYHRENKPTDKPFKYQDYNLDRKSVSRFKFYCEKYFDDNSWEKLHVKLKEFAKRFVSKNVAELDLELNKELLSILETGQKHCVERKQFCFHNSTIVKFLLSSVIKDLRHHNDFKNLEKAIDLDEFYRPYFENHEKCERYYSRIKLKYQTRKWEELHHDIDDIIKYYQNDKQDILNKINLSGIVTTYYQFHKKHEEQNLIIENLIHHITTNPYHNARLYSFINNFFFNDFLFMDKIEEALSYYHDLQKDNTEFKVGSPLYILGVTLNLYDIRSAKRFIPKHKENEIAEIEDFILPYIAKYYHLSNKHELADLYIQHALKKIKKVDSIVYFIETYSTYYMMLFQSKKYKEIIDLYENITFKLRHITSQKIGDYNFEIRFYYLLAKYCQETISLNSLTNKLSNLIVPVTQETHAFTKLKMKKSLDIITQLNIPLDNQLKDRYNTLRKDVLVLEKLGNHV